jgi:cysteine desulfurase / selenocysteine lyase
VQTDLSPSPLDVIRIRRDFPVLDQQVHGKPLVYLDNAASAQRPVQVIDAISDYYRHDHANVHRGVHALSQRATNLFEEARRKVQRLLNAAHDYEIIFTKGCTESINLVANAWGRANLKPGDRVLLSEMEHHANIVPWQIVCAKTGAEVHPIPVTDQGEIALDALEAMLDERVKLVGVVHVSNSLGTINPIKRIAELAHRVGALVLADGAQATAHLEVDVQDLAVDFYTISSHKMYGPTGFGALYGRQEILSDMPPFLAGGDMIRTVSFEKSSYAGLPNRFEPGTPHISGAIGLGAAIDYLEGIGYAQAAAHEIALARWTENEFRQMGGVRIIGEAAEKAGIVSFVVDGVHPHDVGTVLDSEGIAVRAGHHCCMPLMHRLGVPATTRASFAFYNTVQEAEALVSGVKKLKAMFTS